MRIPTESSRARHIGLLVGLSFVLAGPALASGDVTMRPGPAAETPGKVPTAITKRINGAPEPELVRVPGVEKPAPQQIAADEDQAPPPAKTPAPKKPVEARDDDDDDDDDAPTPPKKAASPPALPAAPKKVAEPPAAPPAPQRQPDLPAAPPPVVASPPPAGLPSPPVAVSPPPALVPAPVAVTPPAVTPPAAPPAAVPRITEVKPDPRQKNPRAPLTLSTGRSTPVTPQGEPQACPEGMECTVCLAGCINRPGEILHMQVKRATVKEPDPATKVDDSTQRPRVRRGGGRSTS